MSELTLADDLISIPGGTFTMGISDTQIEYLTSIDESAAQWQKTGRFVREQPGHRVFVSACNIGRTPVTVGQFRPFIDDGGYDSKGCWTRDGWEWLQRSVRRQPEFWGVSWFEAIENPQREMGHG